MSRNTHLIGVIIYISPTRWDKLIKKSDQNAIFQPNVVRSLPSFLQGNYFKNTSHLDTVCYFYQVFFSSSVGQSILSLYIYIYQ